MKSKIEELEKQLVEAKNAIKPIEEELRSLKRVSFCNEIRYAIANSDDMENLRDVLGEGDWEAFSGRSVIQYEGYFLWANGIVFQKGSRQIGIILDSDSEYWESQFWGNEDIDTNVDIFVELFPDWYRFDDYVFEEDICNK